MPIRSMSASGPIGQPAPALSARSTSSGAAPVSSSIRAASLSSGISSRLTRKPGVSGHGTASLPRPCAKASAAANASSSTTAVRTTSTSGISGAGLKKCRPTTRSGRPLADAMAVTDSAEVLVARIVSGRQSAWSSANSAALGAGSSTMASITRSASASGARSPPAVKRPRAASAVAASSAPFSTRLASPASMRPLPRSSARGVGLDRDDAMPRLEAHLRDPGAHRPEPHDAYGLDRHPRPPPRSRASAGIVGRRRPSPLRDPAGEPGLPILARMASWGERLRAAARPQRAGGAHAASPGAADTRVLPPPSSAVVVPRPAAVAEAPWESVGVPEAGAAPVTAGVGDRPAPGAPRARDPLRRPPARHRRPRDRDGAPGELQLPAAPRPLGGGAAHRAARRGDRRGARHDDRAPPPRAPARPHARAPARRPASPPRCRPPPAPARAAPRRSRARRTSAACAAPR